MHKPQKIVVSHKRKFNKLTNYERVSFVAVYLDSSGYIIAPILSEPLRRIIKKSSFGSHKFINGWSTNGYKQKSGDLCFNYNWLLHNKNIIKAKNEVLNLLLPNKFNFDIPEYPKLNVDLLNKLCKEIYGDYDLFNLSSKEKTDLYDMYYKKYPKKSFSMCIMDQLRKAAISCKDWQNEFEKIKKGIKSKDLRHHIL